MDLAIVVNCVNGAAVELVDFGLMKHLTFVTWTGMSGLEIHYLLVEEVQASVGLGLYMRNGEVMRSRGVQAIHPLLESQDSEPKDVAV